MGTKLILVAILFISSFSGICQKVPFSPVPDFNAEEVKFEPLVFKRVPSQVPVSILSLNKIRFNVNFTEITNYPSLYNWVKLGQQFNDVNILNPYYRRQDANGRDLLPQDGIGRDVINNLLRRNFPW